MTRFRRPETTWSREQVYDYLRRIHKECNWLEIHGICSDGPMVFDLEDFYVPLTAPTPLSKKETPREKARTLQRWKDQTPLARRTPGCGPPDMPPTRQPVRRDEGTLDALLRKHRHLVVSGEPGSGKTTFLAYVASVLSRALGRSDRELLKDRLGFDGPGPVPLPVSLRDLAEWATVEGAREHFPGRLLTPLAATLARQFGAVAPDEKTLERLCASGRALLLLDGVDEVLHEGARAVLLDGIRDVCAAYPKTRVVVACRAPVFSRQVERLVESGFSATMVFPFDSPDIWEFAIRWSATAYYGSIRLKDEQVALSSAIKGGARTGDGPIRKGIRDRALSIYRALLFHHALGELAGNPLIVTATCAVLHNRRMLPDHASEALFAMVESQLSLRARCGFEGSPRGRHLFGDASPSPDSLATRGDVHRFLGAMAAKMRGRPGSVARETALSWLTHNLFHDTDEELAEPFIVGLVKHGLLLPIDDGRYAFRHEAFQDHYGRLHRGS